MKWDILQGVQCTPCTPWRYFIDINNRRIKTKISVYFVFHSDNKIVHKPSILDAITIRTLLMVMTSR